ncbi:MULTISPECIES: hypothetical protein [Rhizobium]|uniref:Uncharacterized protein n=1 Tax=Rhizobium aouanii TaxID=3118145 RepID=A0ABU8CJE8_9HYPH|nr:hypothetical protein [Rhizobium acaciae]MCW1410872.1 hypothetical protein [Rhizobium acaciae]MCW1742829.1 hypothetical protein [Rhizobium acaciae]MCW1750025.1 hypothetical protein [Rhizobium acaciae]
MAVPQSAVVNHEEENYSLIADPDCHTLKDYTTRRIRIAIKLKSGPSFMLASGNWFDLLDPWGSAFTIFDIAQGLSNICRYAGQCKKFYSVAEHSIHVCETAQYWTHWGRGWIGH